MFYATQDHDDGRISQNASVFAFENEAQARAYLLKGFDASDWNLDTVEIGTGRFGDCWIKVHSAPTGEEKWLAPFSADQLSVLAPGQHPGGRAWWIEPIPPVLVVSFIQALDD